MLDAYCVNNYQKRFPFGAENLAYNQKIWLKTRKSGLQPENLACNQKIWLKTRKFG